MSNASSHNIHRASFGGTCSPIETIASEDENSFVFDNNEASLPQHTVSNPTESEELEDENDLSADEDLYDMVFLTKRTGFNVDKYKHEESMKFGNR